MDDALQLAEKKGDGWGSRTEVFPSWFEEEVATQLKQRVLDEVKVAVEAKQDELCARSLPS
ncbi:MAG: hypothetical protein U0800_12600 [Isosphaeraceae bacterium]